jgi:hypothetical protein
VVVHSATGSAPSVPFVPAGRPEWLRRLRRGALFGLSVFYAGFLVALVPLALTVGLFHQPFDQRH